MEVLSAQMAQVLDDERRAKADRDLAEGKLSLVTREIEKAALEAGVGKTSSADQALDAWAQLAAAKKRLGDLRAEQEGVAADEARCLQAADAVMAAARAASLQAADAPTAAVAIEQALAEREEAHHLAQRLEAQAEAASRADRRSQDTVAELEQGCRRLIETAGCASEEEVWAKADRAKERGLLERELRELAVKVEAGAGLSPEEARRRLDALGGAEKLEGRRLVAERTIAALASTRKELAEQKGALAQKLAAFEQDGQVAELRAEEETAITQAAQLSRQYAIDALALHLLEAARGRFEKDQQPKVVRLASTIFEGLTAGRYERVFTRPDVPQKLFVARSGNKDLAAEKLSRGTRELLYLAFRLAVIEDFGESRAALPVVVDDILVNIDPRRQSAVVQAFAELAKKHQILALTCHPSVRDLLVAQQAKAIDLSPRPQAVTTVRIA
jgi:uncharacterized protein YhaN